MDHGEEIELLAAGDGDTSEAEEIGKAVDTSSAGAAPHVATGGGGPTTIAVAPLVARATGTTGPVTAGTEAPGTTAAVEGAPVPAGDEPTTTSSAPVSTTSTVASTTTVAPVTTRAPVTAPPTTQPATTTTVSKRPPVPYGDLSADEQAIRARVEEIAGPLVVDAGLMAEAAGTGSSTTDWAWKPNRQTLSLINGTQLSDCWTKRTIGVLADVTHIGVAVLPPERGSSCTIAVVTARWVP